jgi:hypothetical protein
MLSGWNHEGSPVLLIETGARTGSCVAKEWPIFYLTNEYDGEIMSRTLFGLPPFNTQSHSSWRQHLDRRAGLVVMPFERHPASFGSWTSSDTLLAKGVMFFQGFWLTLR